MKERHLPQRREQDRDERKATYEKKLKLTKSEILVDHHLVTMDCYVLNSKLYFNFLQVDEIASINE